MELSHNLVRRLEVVVIKALDHPSGSIAEEGRLPVVPVSCQRIHTELLPELGQDLILTGQELLEINKDGSRLARDVPPSDADPESLGSCLHPPAPVQCRILDEVRVALGVHPHIRAHHDVAPAELALEIKGFGGDNSINTAYLITHFPTNFKQIIRLDNFCFHFTIKIYLVTPAGVLVIGIRPGKLYQISPLAPLGRNDRPEVSKLFLGSLLCGWLLGSWFLSGSRLLYSRLLCLWSSLLRFFGCKDNI